MEVIGKGDRYIYTTFISIDCELIIIGVTAVGATIDHEILAVIEVTIQLMPFDYFLCIPCFFPHILTYESLK